MEELKEWNYKVGIKLNIELRKNYTIFKYGKMGKIFRNVGRRIFMQFSLLKKSNMLLTWYPPNQGAQVILTGLGGCALLIFSLSMFFCCVQRWISLLHYHEMSRSPSSQELLFKENEVVQFEVAKPTLIYCTKDIPYQKNQKSR